MRAADGSPLVSTQRGEEGEKKVSLRVMLVKQTNKNHSPLVLFFVFLILDPSDFFFKEKKNRDSISDAASKRTCLLS